MNDPELYNRLVARIRKDALTGCWIWTGPAFTKRPSPGNRYGYIGVRFNGRSKTVATHRAMWLALHGKPDKGLCVCHRCDNVLCVNPEHLWLGTHLQNMADCRAKNRYYYANLTHCKHGHPFDEKNTYYRPSDGLRACKACQREHQRRRWHENPEYYRARQRAWRARRKLQSVPG